MGMAAKRQTTCSKVPKTHSYYNAQTKQCYCTNGTPFQNSLQVGSANDCGANYDNRNIRTTFYELTPECYATQPVGINAGNTATFTGLNGCLNSCKGSLRATYWANRAVSACWSAMRNAQYTDRAGKQLLLLMRLPFIVRRWRHVRSYFILCQSPCRGHMSLALTNRDSTIPPKPPRRA